MKSGHEIGHGASFNFHDSCLLKVVIGPRREVRLHVQLDLVWNPGCPEFVVAHLSKIENFNEVRTWLETFSGEEHLGLVGALDRVGKDVVLDLDRHGKIVFRASRLVVEPPTEEATD